MTEHTIKITIDGSEVTKALIELEAALRRVKLAMSDLKVTSSMTNEGASYAAGSARYVADSEAGSVNAANCKTGAAWAIRASEAR